MYFVLVSAGFAEFSLAGDSMDSCLDMHLHHMDVVFRELYISSQENGKNGRFLQKIFRRRILTKRHFKANISLVLIGKDCEKEEYTLFAFQRGAFGG